jgi:hypothetical protein
MTAAHCVDPVVVGTGNTFYVFLGDNINDMTQVNTPGNVVAVKETHYDQAFNMSNLTGGHDVGVVITGAAIPRAPLPMHRAAITDAELGQPVRLVGYGVDSGTDTMGTSAGQKRQTNTTLGQYDSMFLEFDDPAHLTCEGDSGGPAFMTFNGVEEIVGITSFGDQGCTMYGVDSRVDVVGAFVDNYIQQFDPGSGQAPDMAMGGGAPDLARGGAPDLDSVGGGGDMTILPGQMGASCTSGADCNSGVCDRKGSTGYCTEACDPSKMNACPAGFFCGTSSLGDAGAQLHLCVRRGSSGGGCAVDGGRTGRGAAGAGLLALVALLGVGLAARRRRDAA